MIVRSPDWTILIEAKILAGEQPGQGGRLESLWTEEVPILVFLTKSGRVMNSGSNAWVSYTWREVADRLRAALDIVAPDKLLAAREYLKTLETYLR